MHYAFSRPSKHMATLERLVTAKVTAALTDAGETKSRLIVRLRRIEETASQFGADSQTLQVIRSGRRLLGDRHDPRLGAYSRVPTNRWLR